MVWARTNIDSENWQVNLEKSRNQWKATELGKIKKNIWNRVESKQEEADQDQETPKLDVTRESTENKKDTSELSECNVGKLGELNQDSLKPCYSKVKLKIYRKWKLEINQVINIEISICDFLRNKLIFPTWIYGNFWKRFHPLK